MLRTLHLNIVCALAIAAGLMQCGYPNTEKMADVNPVMWRVDDAAKVEVSGHDTAGMYGLDILMMFDADFDRRPLTLNITVIAPDSTRFSESVRLADFPNAHKHKAYYHLWRPYRDSVRLSMQGTYFFEITPARGVAGVRSAGINIRNLIDGKE